MKAFRISAAALIVVLASALASEQSAVAQQPAGKNLQVMAKDTPMPQIIGSMQRITSALGVGCAHCHVFVGPNDPGNDFASDAKPTKNIARAMMRMTRDIRPMVAAAVAPKPASDVTLVHCATCHRGAAIPVLPPEPAGRGRGNL